MKFSLLLLLFFIPAFSTARAEESVQPYIDQLKRQMKEKSDVDNEEATPDTVQPFIDSVKEDLETEKPAAEQEQSYIDSLKAKNPKLSEEKDEGSYTEQQKEKLTPKEEGGAIQSVLEGRSELHPKKVGTIRNAFGIRYGAALTRNLTAPAGTQLRNFNDVYGAAYAPDLSFFFEFQPFHSEIFGNIGIMVLGGLAYYQGLGQFSFNIPTPSGGTFPAASSTKLQFFTAPAVVAADYRFNLLKYLKPFVMAGPAAIGYLENRNDGISGNHGYSLGVYAAGGVSILCDWIYPTGAWDLYTSFGIQHYYLTLEFSNLSTFSGLVNVNIYGLTAGLTFEY